ncbi:long-chain-fatty-acid--CoA ligase [Paenarthrobacter aurescens]|uniref:long-chain-fatty-acid--CoA ligase n=1 Tax=Paenarthrobacter aurescens TaxID=43663 RepID=UPI0035E7230D
MQDWPLAVPQLLDGMERRFRDRWVSSRDLHGTTRSTFREVAGRVRRLAGVLDALDVPAGARVATFGWNTQRHLELYLAVPSTGRVLHTINHRLPKHQLDYIVEDAEDDVVFIDRSILEVVWPVLDRSRSLRHIVVMDDGGPGEIPAHDRVVDYETLMARAKPVDGPFSIQDDRAAAALCYTSGTTGDPKGVLYDHRSIVLHALLLLTADAFAISRRDTVMPVVPMFHVNAWGLPYASLMAGANISLPGSRTDPASLAGQLVDDDVTFAAAVATVWRSMLPHLEGLPDRPRALRTLVSGGGGIPPTLSRDYHRVVGIGLTNAWGMTETSPVVTTSSPGTLDGPATASEPEALITPGPNLPLTMMRLRRDGEVLMSDDGVISGELEVAGPTIAAGYFGAAADSDRFTEDGWLKTGDIATLDPAGRLRIVDRSKDLIKSGGEWISSTELESAIMEHPAVAESAVVGRSDDRWSERPVACVVLRAGQSTTSAEIQAFLRDRVATWWIPEDVLFVEEIPKTATGKFSKLRLKEQLGL